ncbi:PF20 [Scenedesmus sp. PABB004]|nr:PF20 [Scenedesmus sp. PABB004]
MALLAKSTAGSRTAFAGRSRAAPKVARSVQARAYGPDRPLWYPGNPAPAYLDGTLAGDYGFDPLGLSSDPETMRWMVHAELQNARWAMLGAAGVLLTSIGAAVGLPFPEWFEAGKAPLPSTVHGDWSLGTLTATMFLLFHWAEQKRIMDFRNPGSQGDGSFFGITDDFKSKENGYPGGRLFDPIGFSRGDEAIYKKYKQNEIVNGRLAMVANLGFWAQYAATGKGPIQNLADHLADPYHTTFTTNGISVPFYNPRTLRRSIAAPAAVLRAAQPAQGAADSASPAAAPRSRAMRALAGVLPRLAAQGGAEAAPVLCAWLQRMLDAAVVGSSSGSRRGVASQAAAAQAEPGDDPAAWKRAQRPAFSIRPSVLSPLHALHREGAEVEQRINLLGKTMTAHMKLSEELHPDELAAHADAPDPVAAALGARRAALAEARAAHDALLGQHVLHPEMSRERAGGYIGALETMAALKDRAASDFQRVLEGDKSVWEYWFKDFTPKYAGLPGLGSLEKIMSEAREEGMLRQLAALRASAPRPAPAPRVDHLGRARAVGGRKTSVAQVYLWRGEGRVLVNRRPLDAYFGDLLLRSKALRPLAVTGLLGGVDVLVQVDGGGSSGQAQAAAHGIAKALRRLDPGLRPALKAAGLLKRDPRMVERKKPGKAKARKGFAWPSRPATMNDAGSGEPCPGSPLPDGPGGEGEASDDDFEYQEVELVSEDEDDDISEDLDAAMRSLQALTSKRPTGSPACAAARLSTPPGGVVRRPEVVDDFVRNWCAKMGLSRTAEAFEAEWYEAKATGRLPEAPQHVPDVYLHNGELEEELAGMRGELAAAREVAARAAATWDKFRKARRAGACALPPRAAPSRTKPRADRCPAPTPAGPPRRLQERDFHRMHHKRVAQEKNRLIADIKRLKARGRGARPCRAWLPPWLSPGSAPAHYAKYEPTILELRRKYEAALKEKMLAGLERDKMAAKAGAARSAQRAQRAGGRQHEQRARCAAGLLPTAARPPRRVGAGRRDLAARDDDDLELTPAQVGGFTCQKSFKARRAPARACVRLCQGPAAAIGAARRARAVARPDRRPRARALAQGHLLPVANVALHPSKPILATASDDKTWKLWHLPHGDLIMCGEGHKDWVAGVDFHPSGTSLASGSGDSTVKIWSFERQRCVATLSDHKQAVWGVRYHDQGDWLASCSLDHSVRLWDLALGRCRQVLRGHVDSVNDVHWQPAGAAICTGSSDKTVSTWDPRSGLSTSTFYGHRNSVNAVAYSARGTMIASTDADGGVRLWDVRMVAEVLALETGKYPANKAAFDASGAVLAVASDDGKVRCLNTRSGEVIVELCGHEDAVQAAVFDPAAQYLVSCGSDNTFKLWS